MTPPTSSTWSRYLLAATGTATVAASSASAAIVYWNPADVTAFQSPPGDEPTNFFNFDMLEGLASIAEGRSATAFAVDVSGDYVQIYNMTVPSGIVSTFAGSAFLASKLAFGTPIDGNSSFNTGYGSAFFDFGNYLNNPDWNTGNDGVTGYVGLKFEILPGETHYGWARFTYNDTSNNLVLNDFAYENVAGVGILAGAGAAPIPEPGSAALVAALAAGSIATYRRRRQAA